MNATLLQNALNFRRAGKFAEAADIYIEILRGDAQNFEAIHGLGILNYMAGRLDDAARLIGEAVKLNPAAPDAAYNLGCVLARMKRHDEALASFDAALKAKPDYIEALVNRANVLGVLVRHEEALANLDRVVALKPAIAEAWNNRAAVLVALNRLEEALESYDKGLSLRAGNLEALRSRGSILQLLGRLEDAIDNSDTALALAPQDANLIGVRADLLLQLGRNEEAAVYYERFLALKPDEVAGWYCRGLVLQALRRLDEALLCFDKTIALNPDHFAARIARANIRFEMEKFAGAAGDYEVVLGGDPMAPHYVRGYLAVSQLHCCDWVGLPGRRTIIAEDIRAGYFVLDPIGNALISHSLDEQRMAADIWRKDKIGARQAPLWRGERYGHDKIRLAYLSADLRAHATAFLMAGVFEEHDKSRFETVAISFGADDKSAMRRRLEQAFGQFIDVRGKSDAEVAALLREKEIDIAVDLKGYTAEGRLGILSYRPAPVQAHYLAFPGTLAADYVDYLIADATVIPPEHQAFYSEKIVTLPDTYQCNDRARSVAPRVPSRAEAGLPERGFVFCCFNNNHKIMPEMFDIWMRLLRAVEGSVLWLLQDNEDVVRNLRREAQARGVTPERLVFARRTAPADHLARQTCADLFLDTLPYNAHTTASDALWVGLPLVTALGATFAGRVAGSLLRAAGMPELVTDSLEAYEALALKIARDPTMLAGLKAKLAANRDSCALFDTRRITRHLEAAYTGMWERAMRGEAPESFAVAPP